MRPPWNDGPCILVRSGDVIWWRLCLCPPPTFLRLPTALAPTCLLPTARLPLILIRQPTGPSHDVSGLNCGGMVFIVSWCYMPPNRGAWVRWKNFSLWMSLPRTPFLSPTTAPAAALLAPAAACALPFLPTAAAIAAFMLPVLPLPILADNNLA